MRAGGTVPSVLCLGMQPCMRDAGHCSVTDRMAVPYVYFVTYYHSLPSLTAAAVAEYLTELHTPIPG